MCNRSDSTATAQKFRIGSQKGSEEIQSKKEKKNSLCGSIDRYTGDVRVRVIRLDPSSSSSFYLTLSDSLVNYFQFHMYGR